MDAWEEGYNAAIDDKPVTSNPYRTEPNETAFLFGYHEGRKARNAIILRAFAETARAAAV